VRSKEKKRVHEGEGDRKEVSADDIPLRLLKRKKGIAHQPKRPTLSFFPE